MKQCIFTLSIGGITWGSTVDVVREYVHVLVLGPTALMATLASDSVGRELFEYWHYEDLHTASPTTVENLSDAPL